MEPYTTFRVDRTFEQELPLGYYHAQHVITVYENHYTNNMALFDTFVHNPDAPWGDEDPRHDFGRGSIELDLALDVRILLTNVIYDPLLTTGAGSSQNIYQLAPDGEARVYSRDRPRW